MADIMTLALDPETRDLIIDDTGMLLCVYDGEAIAQNIRNTLLVFQGEFPLNTAHGTEWGRVVGKPKYEAEDEADDVVRAAVFQEPYVREIEEMSIAADRRSIGIGLSGVLHDGTTVRVEVNNNG